MGTQPSVVPTGTLSMADITAEAASKLLAFYRREEPAFANDDKVSKVRRRAAQRSCFDTATHYPQRAAAPAVARLTAARFDQVIEKFVKKGRKSGAVLLYNYSTT